MGSIPAMASQADGRKSKPAKRAKNVSRSLKRKRDVDDHETLQKAIEELDPKAEVKDFSDLPLSQLTASGLEASHFKTLTDIQSKAVPLALKGRSNFRRATIRKISKMHQEEPFRVMM